MSFPEDIDSLRGLRVGPRGRAAAPARLRAMLAKRRGAGARELAERGWLLFCLGRGEEALTALERALRLEDSAVVQVWRGAVLKSLGRDAQAEAAFTSAIALRPEAAAAHFGRAETRKNLRRWEEGLRDASQAIRLAPGDAQGYQLRARLLVQLRRADEALKDLDAAVRLAPRSSEARAWRAELLRRAGRLAEARRDFDAALRLRPVYAQAYAWRGMLKHAAGQDACADLRAAVRRLPDYALAHAWLGRVLGEKGDLAAAREALGRALKLDPGYAWAREQLARLEAPPVEKEPSYDVMLGYACNVECRFCSQELSWRKDGWLPLKTACEKVFAAHRRGCRILNILGGEATAYPNIVALVAFARKTGFRTIQFETNGLRLADAAFARDLVRAGLTRLSFSVHGHEAAVHDRLVQKAGAFDRIWKALDVARALGVSTRVAFVLNRLNVDGLERFCRLFLSEKGVREFQFIYPLYTGDFLNYLEELALPLGQAARAVERAFRYLDAAEGTAAIAHNMPPCLLPGRLDRIGDWQDVGMSVLKPDGREHVDTPQEPLYRKSYARACERCSLRRRCVGVDPAYLRHWGEDELKPVLEETAA